MPQHNSATEKGLQKGAQAADAKVAVTLPLRLVQRNIPFLRKHGLGVEVMLYDTNWICNWPKEKIARIARQLQAEQIDVLVHGPVHDLNPGSLDVVIRNYTQHCYFKTLAICQALDAKALVLHLGINPLLPESALDKWLESSLPTWTPIIELAEQLKINIHLENMFLPSPFFLVALKKRLDSPVIKFCFDIAHFHVYSSTPLEQWLDALKDDIAELHVNDNLGADDEHLALGEGKIDFRAIFQKLAARNIRPWLTLEMTSDKFEPSLEYLAKNNLLQVFSEKPDRI